MINSRFLNYKHYNSFIRDLNDNQISKDAIVFIQDESHTCIWTHDKEYLCNVSKSNLEEGTLVFGDGYGSNVFTIELSNNSITLTDSDGNSYSVNIQPPVKRGKYISIGNNNTINWTLDMDDQLDSTSTNPVENKAIYTALGYKADKNEVLRPEDIVGKQDKLKAGRGIEIRNNTISSTLDTEVYVILTQDEFPPENPSENKIYLVQVSNGDGTYRYIQYVYKNGQWNSTDQIIPEVTITGYLTKDDADDYYQPKGSYIKIGDVKDYCDTYIVPTFNNYYTKQWIDEYLQLKPENDEFVTKSWCDSRYVKKTSVYTPKSGNVESNAEGETTPIDSGTGYTNIIVDRVLSTASENPVQNKVITSALNDKVDNTTLSSYATKTYVTSKINKLHLESYVVNDTFDAALSLKQDVLTAGDGISITDNVISSTIDTNVFVIVDQLPINPSQNKLYILQTQNQDDSYTYTQHRWNGSEWILIGDTAPEVNLQPYLKKTTAAKTYQPKGSYVTSDEFNLYKQIVEQTYQMLPTDDTFVTYTQLQTTVSNLKKLIKNKCVLKTDVYEPTNEADWESAELPPIDIPDDTQPSGGNGGGSGNNSGNGGYIHLFLEQEQYDNLSSYSANTIYFIYEESEQSETWAFGDEFPVILS